MYSFKNDYSEGAHANILMALQEYSVEQNTGYGLDKYSLQAERCIKEKMKYDNADIHFLSGGTQTNMLAVYSWLRPHQAVISAETGHINVYETGTIEAGGHKILAVPTVDGKLSVELINSVLVKHVGEHMVQPKMVYVSQPTEMGTIYSKKELQLIADFCREKDLYFYMDGARLAAALTCTENDVLLEDLPHFFDAFYIGATKCGAFLGEALVICKNSFKTDFRFLIKQQGAMLAKGHFVGVQFLELFRQDLYWKIGEQSNKMAEKLRKGLRDLGIEFWAQSPTNQLFPTFTNELVEKLQQEYEFNIWRRYDNGNTTIRLVTSWATNEVEIDKFICFVKNNL